MAKGSTKAKLIVEQANARAMSLFVANVKITPKNDAMMKYNEILLAFGEMYKNIKLYTKTPTENRIISIIKLLILKKIFFKIKYIKYYKTKKTEIS